MKIYQLFILASLFAINCFLAQNYRLGSNTEFSAKQFSTQSHHEEMDYLPFALMIINGVRFNENHILETRIGATNENSEFLNGWQIGSYYNYILLENLYVLSGFNFLFDNSPGGYGHSMAYSVHKTYPMFNLGIGVHSSKVWFVGLFYQGIIGDNIVGYNQRYID